MIQGKETEEIDILDPKEETVGKLRNVNKQLTI